MLLCYYVFALHSVPLPPPRGGTLSESHSVFLSLNLSHLILSTLTLTFGLRPILLHPLIVFLCPSLLSALILA